MPYDSTKDLPQGVKNSLPSKAQEIYRSTFNSAWQKYDGDEGDDSKEEIAHRIAWGAVKNKYEKSDGGWQKK